MIHLRMALVTIVLPVALAVVAIALQIAWLPSLPAEIATHWNFADQPDGFGPAWSAPVLTVVIGALPALIGGTLITRFTPADGPSIFQKLLGAVIVLLAAMIAVIGTGTLAIQLPGASGADAGAGTIVLVASIAAVLLALAAWFLMPRTGTVAAQARAADPVAVAPGERVAWVGIARYALPMLLGLIGLVIVGLGVAVYLIVTTGIWFMLLLPVVLAVSLLGTASWRVRADAGGLAVRGLLGWPLYRVPAGEILSAGTLDVRPTGEFGGWGIRFGRGRRLGIITRSGEALEVQRRDGRAVVVTVDDAATAAGVLEAYASKVQKG